MATDLAAKADEVEELFTERPRHIRPLLAA
jgi:hypothetical protein